LVLVSTDRKAGTNAESFPALLGRRAPARDFTTWFRNAKPSSKLSSVAWHEQVLPALLAATDLGWMPAEDRSLVQRCILDYALRAFTELWRSSEHTSTKVLSDLEPFVRWVESLSDDRVVTFCWNLLRYERSFTPEPVWWLKRSGRLSGSMSYENISLAVALADEADAMYWWPEERWLAASWDRDRTPYIGLLDHESYLVRAAASKCLGALFFGTQTNAEDDNISPLRSLLPMIQDREIRTPGVAGPFLHGAQWSVEPEEWSSFSADTDMKAWFIETLGKSRPERDVPHILSLEFYAHELFSSDADAIRQFLRMGRNELAVMTATENPSAIDDLLPVLKEMSMSDNTQVSAAIREYLSVRSHHAGAHHLTAAEL
jgi:hypothetical protein